MFVLECQRGDTMYETTRKYSEQIYCTKEDILKEMESYLVDPIWQEIKVYRSFFRHDLHLNEKPYYLIRNALVVNQTLQIEKMLIRYDAKQVVDDYQLYCPYLSDEQNIHFEQYLHHLLLTPQINAEDFYQSFFQQFQIQDVYKDHITYLLNEEEPFLLRLYSLILLNSRRSLSLLFLPFLIMNGMVKLCHIFPFLNFADEWQSSDEQDITYGYLDMLKRLRLILYKKMVLLNIDKEPINIHLQENELLERYPSLKKEQIHFYVQHRSLGHYYTIQNYINTCEVCYETARYSLDQLVEYHWYDKKKIGKKFVYHVV